MKTKEPRVTQDSLSRQEMIARIVQVVGRTINYEVYIGDVIAFMDRMYDAKVGVLVDRLRPDYLDQLKILLRDWVYPTRDIKEQTDDCVKRVYLWSLLNK